MSPPLLPSPLFANLTLPTREGRKVASIDLAGRALRGAMMLASSGNVTSHLNRMQRHQEEAEALNERFRSIELHRTQGPVVAAFHTRVPFLIAGGRYNTEGGAAEVSLDSMPPGYDEGMVRLASVFRAAGRDLAQQELEKEAAGALGGGMNLLKSVGTAAGNAASRVGGAVTPMLRQMHPETRVGPSMFAGVGTAIKNTANAGIAGAKNMAAGVGQNLSNIGSNIKATGQAAVQGVQNANQAVGQSLTNAGRRLEHAAAGGSGIAPTGDRLRSWQTGRAGGALAPPPVHAPAPSSVTAPAGAPHVPAAPAPTAHANPTSVPNAAVAAPGAPAVGAASGQKPDMFQQAATAAQNLKGNLTPGSMLGAAAIAAGGYGLLQAGKKGVDYMGRETGTPQYAQGGLQVPMNNNQFGAPLG